MEQEMAITDKQAAQLPTPIFLHVPPPNVTCGTHCATHYTNWRNWFIKSFDSVRPEGAIGERDPQALLSVTPASMLPVPETLARYEYWIGNKSRNMFRKPVKNGYSFAEFEADQYFDDIYAINTSTESRSDRPMSDSYRQRPTGRAPGAHEYCALHRQRNFGIFREGVLYAYCRIAVLGEFAPLNTIIGHYEHLKYGIMNMLIHALVKQFIDEGRQVKCINYLRVASSTEKLAAFKQSVGFYHHPTYWIEDADTAAHALADSLEMKEILHEHTLT